MISGAVVPVHPGVIVVQPYGRASSGSVDGPRRCPVCLNATSSIVRIKVIHGVFAITAWWPVVEVFPHWPVPTARWSVMVIAELLVKLREETPAWVSCRRATAPVFHVLLGREHFDPLFIQCVDVGL